MSSTAEETDLKTHVSVCAERYNGINSRLSRIESILLGSTGFIVISLIGIAWKVASH